LNRFAAFGRHLRQTVSTRCAGACVREMSLQELGGECVLQVPPGDTAQSISTNAKGPE
jgi:hypothetical protein